MSEANTRQGTEIPMQTNEFKTYHPIVNFLYFVSVIGLSMMLLNPICLLISLLGSFCYSVMLKGIKAIRQNLLYMLPMIILMALFNPMFNHEGVTILTYLPSGNPLTLESIIYGLVSAIMIVSVICWFSCYNEVMTSDKFIYLFGKIIPALSLVLSMTLRFIPKFIKELKALSNAQHMIGKGISDGSFLRRTKNALSIFSAMISRALEGSVTTADSMKSRGYGLPGRSAFSIFTFDRRDLTAILFITVAGIYVITGRSLGCTDFNCFPSIQIGKLSFYSTTVYFSYLALCLTPIIIEIREVIKWKSLKQKT